MAMSAAPAAPRRRPWQTFTVGLRSPVGRRTTWSLADQCLSSLTNFGLSVVVARNVHPREFGAFGLVFATYLIVLNISRALGSQPLMIRFSAGTPEQQRTVIPEAMGVAVIVGGLAAIVVAVLAVFTAGSRATLLVLAITLPGLMLQDAWRFVFFSGARPAAAAANDAVWAAFQVVAFAVCYSRHAHTVAPWVLGWGMAAFAAGIFGIFQSRAVPSLAGGVRWVVAHRDIGPLLSLEFFATSGTGQLTLFTVAAVAGLGAVASLRAAQLVLGPLSVLFMGVLLVALPELTRVYRRDPDRVPRLAMLVGLLFAVSSLVVGVAAYLLPDAIGEALLRENWLPARAVIIPSAIGLACSGLMTGAVLEMRIVEAIKETLAMRVGLLVAAVGAATLGAVWWGASGAAWALAGVGAIFAWLSWLQANRVFRDKRARAAAV
jgi:O-antigen/teichoic acid export membrane protein